MTIETTLVKEEPTLADLIESRRDTFAELLPSILRPDRFVRVALQVVGRQPDLAKCTANSIIKSLMEAAELGLEPTGTLGMAYLVPYFNGKSGKMEAKLIPGYRGLISLARRSGDLDSIEARTWRQKDEFSVRYGTDARIDHVPYLGSDDPGDYLGAYMIAKLRNGTWQVEVMSTAEIEVVRRSSKAGSKGPWVEWWSEMARKTVVRRGLKLLPVSIEVERALELEDLAEGGARAPKVVVHGVVATARQRARTRLLGGEQGTDPSAPIEGEPGAPVAPEGHPEPEGSPVEDDGLPPMAPA